MTETITNILKKDFSNVKDISTNILKNTTIGILSPLMLFTAKKRIFNGKPDSLEPIYEGAMCYLSLIGSSILAIDKEKIPEYLATLTVFNTADYLKNVYKRSKEE